MYCKEETINTLIIEKSRFICYLKHIRDEAEYRDYLSEIRRKHYDATHVCSAMICSPIRRSSDDGEPSGTAGVPILNVLDKHGMEDSCALVVRYFGGIKLGKGGLIRAYTEAVSRCIEKAVLYEDVVYQKYELKLSYETANRVEAFLRKNTILLDTLYDIDVTFIFACSDPQIPDTITDITKGSRPQLCGEEIIPKVVE